MAVVIKKTGCRKRIKNKQPLSIAEGDLTPEDVYEIMNRDSTKSLLSNPTGKSDVKIDDLFPPAVSVHKSPSRPSQILQRTRG